MSVGRQDINTLLSSTHNNSIFYWVSILNIFEKYQDVLDIEEVRILWNECELCRLEFNNNSDVYIKKEDTSPNIYAHLNKMYKEQQPLTLIATA